MNTSEIETKGCFHFEMQDEKGIQTPEIERK